MSTQLKLIDESFPRDFIEFEIYKDRLRIDSYELDETAQVGISLEDAHKLMKFLQENLG